MHERPANKITIREITDLAGVGLGTFYEYFSKKEDLIALTIHLHVKHNAEQMKTLCTIADEVIHRFGLIRLMFEHMIHFQIKQVQSTAIFMGTGIFVRTDRFLVLKSIKKLCHDGGDVAHDFDTL